MSILGQKHGEEKPVISIFTDMAVGQDFFQNGKGVRWLACCISIFQIGLRVWVASFGWHKANFENVCKG